jgi:hypothetical protein
MVTLKQVPRQEHMTEIMDKAFGAVHLVSPGPRNQLLEMNFCLRLAATAKAGVTRLQNELDGYCNCEHCVGYDLEEKEVTKAQLALKFRDFKMHLEDLQSRIEDAKKLIDEAVGLMNMAALLSVCPDQ